MTDFFGIDNAVKGMVNGYFQSARRSGRTTRMVEAVKTGDRILFRSGREAVRVQRMCRDLGKDVKCSVASGLNELCPAKGRTFFDHGFIENLYQKSIEDTAKHIESMEKHLNLMCADPEPPVPFRRF